MKIFFSNNVVKSDPSEKKSSKTFTEEEECWH